MTNRASQDEAQEAVLKKITETVDRVDLDRGPQYVAGVLKDLAEAYALVASEKSSD